MCDSFPWVTINAAMITALGYPKSGVRADLRNPQFGLIQQALAVFG